LKLPGDKLIIILGQLVTLYRGSEPVRMSKSTGEMITLQEVIDETGADATRFFLLLTGADTHLDFDLELAKQKTMENPVYYVQYAYARLCNILKNAASSQQPAASSQGLGTRDWGLEKTDFSLLKDEAEIDIIKKLMNYPDDVADCAEIMQPHHLVRYSRELAALLHSYYHKQRVICEDEALMKARLALVESTRIVLSNVLKLLGISAPERM
jgi:arginyl-tRNA synthetase